MAPCWKAFLAVISIVFVSEIVRAVDEARYRSEEIGPCHSCKVFAESFERGIQRTSHLPHNQERLTDIKLGLCEEPRSRANCFQTAEQAWPHVEQWWLEDGEPEFFYRLCVDKLQVCCPKHHYGRQCLPCPGQEGRGRHEGHEGHEGSSGQGRGVCGGRGKCRGDGTRKGNGTCLCDTGYGGDMCGECVSGFYMSSEDGEASCKRCHYSCAGGCRAGSPRDCVACRSGFLFDTDEGCQDVNECDDINICTRDQFCLNSMGSYKCMACDRACKGCYGDSPDMCRKCAKGYSKKGDVCVREREDEEMDQMTATRYMTYLGLLVAGGVLYPRAPALAAGVGSLTLCYIALAESYCRASGHASLLDLPLFTI